MSKLDSNKKKLNLSHKCQFVFFSSVETTLNRPAQTAFDSEKSCFMIKRTFCRILLVNDSLKGPSCSSVQLMVSIICIIWCANIYRVSIAVSGS